MTIDYIPVTVILMMSNNCRRLISDLVWVSPTPWQWKGWGSIQCIGDDDVKKSKRLFRGENVSRGPAAGVLVSLYLWRSCLQLRFYPGWRMISSNAWMVLCKVLEWLSVRFRQEMSVVKCHLLLSSEPQKLPHSTTQKQEKFPFFKILCPKKKKKGKWCPSLAFNWKDICVLRKGNLWCKASSVALSRRKGSHSMAQKLKNRLQHLFQELSHGALSFVKLNPWFLD